jgi:hypothetical protein
LELIILEPKVLIGLVNFGLDLFNTISGDGVIDLFEDIFIENLELGRFNGLVFEFQTKESIFILLGDCSFL